MADKKDVSFIYALQHNVTKKIYIGKTKSLYKRYMFHLTELKQKKHRSKGLQEAFDQYGADFSVYILEEVEDPRERIDYYGSLVAKERVAEVKWMDIYDTLENGYNEQDSASKKLLNKPQNTFPLKEGKPELPKNRKETEWQN